MRGVYAPHPGFSAARKIRPLAYELKTIGQESLRAVMAGFVPAIHALLRGAKNVDARDKPGHDDLW